MINEAETEKNYGIRLLRKKKIRDFHFKMVDQACTCTSSTSPGSPEMTEIQSKKNKTGKQENFPELLNIELMEWKVLLKSPETKAGPPKGASEEDVRFNPTKGKDWGRESAPK